MTKIGDFAPLEQFQELPAESVVPGRAQSVTNVPLDAFPADGILLAQKPVLNLGEASPHLTSNPVASAEMKQMETQLPSESAPEILLSDELTSKKQLELQQLMEKKTRIEATPSNVLKDFENTQRDLVANLK